MTEPRQIRKAQQCQCLQPNYEVRKFTWGGEVALLTARQRTVVASPAWSKLQGPTTTADRRRWTVGQPVRGTVDWSAVPVVLGIGLGFSPSELTDVSWSQYDNTVVVGLY